jgi:hypothetical protein
MKLSLWGKNMEEIASMKLGSAFASADKKTLPAETNYATLSRDRGAVFVTSS